MILVNQCRRFKYNEIVGQLWRTNVFFLSLGLVVTSLRVAGALPPDSANDPIVELPPFLVEAKGLVLHWRYLEYPGYEVLTVCDDDVTQKFVERSIRIEQLLRSVLPNQFQAKSSVSEKLILFDENINRVRSREIMAEMMRRVGENMPEERERPILPWENTGPRSPWDKRKVRVIPNLRLRDVDTTIVFASVANSSAHPMDFTYQLDRIVDLLERRSPALPDWFVEGMIGLYQQTQLKSDHVEFLPAGWTSMAETRAIAADFDRPRLLLSMRDLLAGRRPAKSATPTELDQVWPAQCTLFVRWAVAENSGVKQNALWKLVDRLASEPLSERLFQECFGMGFADARDRLSDYLPIAVTHSRILPVNDLPVLPVLHFRDATATEIARILGDWERLQISYIKKNIPALTTVYIEQARRRLLRNAGNRDPDLLAVKALVEIDAGNPAAARADLESAAASGVVHPRVFYELAVLRYQEFEAESKEGKLDPEQAARVLQPLFIASEQEPALPEVYALMAKVWSSSSQPPAQEDLVRFNVGLRRFPQISPLMLVGIYLNAKRGMTESVIELGKAGWLHAQDPETRNRFKLILSELHTSASDQK